ncbi:glycosyl transferase [Selenomonas caprae]|uniref:Glycosyl transferase n=1 Tax=Selenomonas caprae TaxID=2606905 RepID=A0A5D6WTZ1_9FIRM|nr:glycoside hydrolase family 99-like domain-containing protein [Selenomonas caprae]TYZ29834.1 glycosyl transferase [Selenomonas caprae]
MDEDERNRIENNKRGKELKMDTKIISMYLPQYHVIPENSKFWGEGFTDWVSVKQAKPLYNGHYEPRVPYRNNYYDLSQKENIKWQAEMAKKHGIFGFAMYHYWFSVDKCVLTKPAEIILENKDIDMPFCFAWDNGAWKMSWSNVQGNSWAPMYEKNNDNENGVLIPFILGGEKEWKKHFEYLLPYFKDERYIKTDNKPVFIIWSYSDAINKMAEYWNRLALDYGFMGMDIIFKHPVKDRIPSKYSQFYYEPSHSTWETLKYRVINRFKRVVGYNGHLKKYNYDATWKRIIKNAEKNKNANIYYGGFVDYDDTPRRGVNGSYVDGADPHKFHRYLKRLKSISDKQGKEYIFLTAWNEWGEGAYLEPDTRFGFSYLEAVKDIVVKESRNNK